MKMFAEARNPKAFPPKLFDGIDTLGFATENIDILAMNSIEDEKIELIKCEAQLSSELCDCPGEKEYDVDRTPAIAAVASCQILGPLL
jgi:hypothetical protein